MTTQEQQQHNSNDDDDGNNSISNNIIDNILKVTATVNMQLVRLQVQQVADAAAAVVVLLLLFSASCETIVGCIVMIFSTHTSGNIQIKK